MGAGVVALPRPEERSVLTVRVPCPDMNYIGMSRRLYGKETEGEIQPPEGGIPCTDNAPPPSLRGPAAGPGPASYAASNCRPTNFISRPWVSRLDRAVSSLSATASTASHFPFRIFSALPLQDLLRTSPSGSSPHGVRHAGSRPSYPCTIRRTPGGRRCHSSVIVIRSRA